MAQRCHMATDYLSGGFYYFFVLRVYKHSQKCRVAKWQRWADSVKFTDFVMIVFPKPDFITAPFASIM